MKSFYKNCCKMALIPLAALSFSMASAPSANASVTITPTIVVFEGRDRFADLNLINISEHTDSYQIGWKFMKMTDDNGTYENVAESTTPNFDLTKNMVFTPKRVTIEPSGLQKIRLGLRLKGEPPAPGDYRAHIELTDVGAPDDGEGPSVANKKGAAVGVKIRVGFSIPVIYRVGESTALPVFGNITTGVSKTRTPEITIPVEKVGGPTYGVLGHILVYYNDKVVGEIKNANIFPEITHRTFKVPLTIPQLSGGSIRIVYKHYDAKNSTIYAEKTVPVGQ